jgi:NAD(P)-dependent dehydrogenase (short-subunit alcohol dehydrogenase family)
MSDQNFVDLSGQVAIVTGAGRGLGRAFASALAGAGAHVVITSRSERELAEVVETIQQAGGTATAFAVDVTDRAAGDGLVARSEAQIGPIDLLINNAGVARALGAIAEVDPDAWWREVEINLRGPQLYMHAVLPAMIQRRRGRIINVASGAGLNAVENMSAYAVSKTALIRLSENAAVENQAHGLAIFVISPGPVLTSMVDYGMRSPEVGRRAPDVQAYFKDLYAKDRFGRIEDAAALVLLLASGQADALSGCYLHVKDDVPALIQQADAIQRDFTHRLRLRE